jgi:hypothetical protein
MANLGWRIGVSAWQAWADVIRSRELCWGIAQRCITALQPDHRGHQFEYDEAYFRSTSREGAI